MTAPFSSLSLIAGMLLRLVWRRPGLRLHIDESAVSNSRGILARGGSVLPVILLATLSLAALSTTSGDAAAATPHVGATCAQAADFPYGSAVVGIAETRDGGGYWIVTTTATSPPAVMPPIWVKQTTLNAPDRRHRRDTGWGWLLPRRLRRRRVHLRRRASSKARRDPSTSTSRSSAWRSTRQPGATGWSPPMAGSSPTAHRSSDRLDRWSSTSRSSAWRLRSDGSGYWLVATDGGVFALAFRYWGSTGSNPSQQTCRRHCLRCGLSWLLARRIRRRNLCLQRSVLRINRQHRPERPDRWLEAPASGTDTASSALTAECSPTDPRASTGRPCSHPAGAAGDGRRGLDHGRLQRLPQKTDIPGINVDAAVGRQWARANPSCRA